MDNRKACSKIKTIRKVHGAAAVANNKEKTRLPAKLSASLLSSSPPGYYDENSASSSMITTEQVLYNSQTAFSSLSTSCCCFTSSYIITTETLLNQLLPPAAGKQTTAAAFVAGNSSSSSNKKRTKKKNTLFQNLQKNSAGVSGNQLSAKAAGACNEEDVHLYYVYTNSLCEQYKQPKKPASSLETVSSASASASSSAVLPNINKMSNKHCLRRYFTKNDTISLPSSSAAAASPTSAFNSKKLPRTTATLPAAAAASSATASSTLKPKKKSSKQLNAAADQRKTNYNYCLLIRYLCILWLVTVIKHIDLLIRLILRISTPIISTTSNHHHHHIVKPTTSQPAHASRSSPPTTAPRSATYTKNLRKALPQIGMSSFYTMLTIICLEIILLSTMSSCAKTFYMHWNTSNSIFRIDNTDHIIDVNKGNLAFEFDQVHIICPVYEPGTYENETEKYIIYNVSKVEYETCRITNADPRVIAICDKPQKLMFFTLTFRPFTPQPGGLEFLPGNDYYFISTSSKDDLYRRIGGRCSTNNMKVVFKVCCASEDKDKTTAGGGGSAGSQPRDNTSSTSASGDTKTSSSSNNAEDINGSMGQMPTNQHVNTIGNNLDHRGAGGAVNAGSGLTPNVAGPGIIDINNPAGGMVYGNNINNNGQNPNIIGTSSINSNIDQHNPFGLRPMQHPNNGYNNGLPNGIGTSNGILFTTGHGNMNMVPTGAGGGVSMSGIPQYPGLGFHGQSGIRINNIPMNQHPNMNNINMNNNHHMHHPYDKHPNEVVKNEELTYNSGASFSAAQPFYWHWKQFAVELAASLAARLMAQYELLWNKFAVGTLLQAKQFYHSQNNNNNNLMLLIGASLAVMLMQQLLIYNLTLRRTSEAEGQAAAAATSALSSSVFIFKREETNIYIVSSNSYSNLPQQNTIPQTFIH